MSTVWVPAERTITITTRTGRSLRLNGDTNAVVAGQSRALAAPAMINGQPYVPAEAVFALLGMGSIR